MRRPTRFRSRTPCASYTGNTERKALTYYLAWGSGEMGNNYWSTLVCCEFFSNQFRSQYVLQFCIVFESRLKKFAPTCTFWVIGRTWSKNWKRLPLCGFESPDSARQYKYLWWVLFPSFTFIVASWRVVKLTVRRPIMIAFRALFVCIELFWMKGIKHIPLVTVRYFHMTILSFRTKSWHVKKGQFHHFYLGEKTLESDFWFPSPKFWTELEYSEVGNLHRK